MLVKSWKEGSIFRVALSVCVTKIAEWKTKAADLQRLKFGQLIDIDSLDRMASSAVGVRCAMLVVSVLSVLFC